MARYVFCVQDGAGLHRDEFGSGCEDLDDARQQCRGLSPDTAREELPDGELHTVACDVRGETGRVVCRGKITCEGMLFGSVGGAAPTEARVARAARVAPG